MADFFGSRLLRWLTMPYRSRVMTVASKPFYTVADRILGTKFLEDIAEFFSLMQTMEKGFVARSREVARILGDRRTTFVVVSTLEAAPVNEAEFFVAALGQRRLHLGAVVLNKVLPGYLLEPAASRAAAALHEHATSLGDELAGLVGGDPAQVARVLVEVAESFRNFQVVAKREAEQRAELGAAGDVLVAVPYFDDDITDLAGLARLGDWLWSG
jgi:anion-transporting  ArsA/GET3 family ATPase